MVEKKITSDHGTIQVVDSTIIILDCSNGMKIELSESISCGKCACCGGTSYIYFGGNMISFACDKKNRIKMCIHHPYTCPGITSCANKDEFDMNMYTLKKEKLKEIIDAMFTIHDVVIVEIEMESKEIIAEHFMLNQEYIIKTMEIAELECFILKKDKKIIENRRKMNENGASNAAEEKKA